MKARYVLGLPFVAAAIALFALAGQSAADPSDLFVEDIPPHRHFIDGPTGNLVPVGPQICERPGLTAAFEQFHHNVHHSLIPAPPPGGVITIHTLGPQDGAPGLHPSKETGATITARLCSFPARP